MEKLRSLERLIENLAKLPSVGVKSAERMAYSILEWDEEDIKDFSSSLVELKKNIHKCPICGAYMEEEVCPYCNDAIRDHKKLMVLGYPKDIFTIEKSNVFNGVYHVLGGVISQRNGISIEDLRIDALLERIEKECIEEVIIATNPDIDGETTALYLAKKLQNKNVQVTRLGYGLQMGANIEYVDALTLERALEGRKKL